MSYWFRNAVLYSLDVATFHDSNGDGWGDLAGVRQRLDHLRGLGVDAVWLLPFYRSPWRDNGYDVTDHLAVDPRFGDLADMADLLEAAEQRGIRVIIDLVLQHTSSEHPWFRQARADRNSPYRDYYIWSDEPHETGVAPVFPGHQDGVWARDEVSGQYYRHTFYDDEPDLNTANPKVREEIYRTMRFWLRLGVAGFRIDAAPYLVQQAAKAEEASGPYWFVRQLREQVTRLRPDGVLLAETDVAPKQYADYFADGEGFHLLFNFYLNNFFFLALARRDAEPLRHALEVLPVPPHTGQYATFARNHDEADLGRLSDAERREVLEAFAPDPDMQVYGRGVRRRLAPMLGGDARRIAMAYALLFSLPGAPVVRYGEEIGMGDDLALPERNAIRTPMQWSPRPPAAGFSTAAPERLVAPVISGGRYGYEQVNVAVQSAGRSSLLDEFARLVRARHELSEVGTAPHRALPLPQRGVMGVFYGGGARVLALANLTPDPVRVPVETVRDQTGCDFTEAVDLVSDGGYDPPARGEIDLGGYGYRWLRLPAG